MVWAGFDLEKLQLAVADYRTDRVQRGCTKISAPSVSRQERWSDRASVTNDEYCRFELQEATCFSEIVNFLIYHIFFTLVQTHVSKRIHMTFDSTVIDLTHSLHEKIPSWEGDMGFKSHVMFDYQSRTGDVGFRIQDLSTRAGIGTHIDAPAHCIPGGLSIDNLSLHNLIAPCVMIDVSDRASERYTVSRKDIEEFEQKHGIIEEKSFVIIRTGWDRFWGKPDLYRNNLVFPTLSAEAALHLLERNIVGLGIDTLGPDLPENGFMVHKLLLGHGRYIIENIANSMALPPKGSTTIALPIKIQGGTEAPLRLIALLL